MRDIPLEELSDEMITDLSVHSGVRYFPWTELKTLHWTELEGLVGQFEGKYVSLSGLPLPSQSNELLCFLLPQLAARIRRSRQFATVFHV
jgi:hypothetical protein